MKNLTKRQLIGHLLSLMKNNMPWEIKHYTEEKIIEYLESETKDKIINFIDAEENPWHTRVTIYDTLYWKYGKKEKIPPDVIEQLNKMSERNRRNFTCNE